MANVAACTHVKVKAHQSEHMLLVFSDLTTQLALSGAIKPILFSLTHGWLVGWGLMALLTQNRSYHACRFVGIFYSKL